MKTATAKTSTKTLTLAEALEYRETLKQTFADMQSAWDVVFGLKLRTVYKALRAVTDDVVDAIDDHNKAYTRDYTAIAEEFAAKDAANQFILEGGNKYTFATEAHRVGFFAKDSELQKTNEAYKESLSVKMKEDVAVEYLPMPRSCLPKSLSAPLTAVVYEFLEEEAEAAAGV